MIVVLENAAFYGKEIDTDEAEHLIDQVAESGDSLLRSYVIQASCWDCEASMDDATLFK